MVLSQLRNSVFTKVLWSFIGLHLLNISVDAPDPNPQHIPEDLSINDQESIIEIILEKILGYENAIEEYDDLDTEEQQKKSNGKIDLSNHYLADNGLKRSSIESTRLNFPDHHTHLTNGFHELDTPPPKL
ncbi:MAG: hypothetical protein R3279_12665 [Putridiphycobacter sp.]|nr:hypothetical protein [Putridiphycobacter sp.]